MCGFCGNRRGTASSCFSPFRHCETMAALREDGREAEPRGQCVPRQSLGTRTRRRRLLFRFLVFWKIAAVTGQQLVFFGRDEVQLPADALALAGREAANAKVGVDTD